MFILAHMQTGEEFEAEYAARLGAERYRNMNLTDFILSGSVYDAMWAIAVGLHNASESVARNDSTGCDQQPGELVLLEDFEYDNEKMGCMLRKSFSQVSFSGVTVGQHAYMHHSYEMYLHATLYFLHNRVISILTAMEAELRIEFALSSI